MSDPSQYLTWSEALETWILRLCELEGTRPLGQFLACHGSLHQGAPLPDDVPSAPPRTCFGSAQEYLIRSERDDIFYAEGIACPASLGRPLPLPHGWLIDRKGRVLDRVWGDAERSVYLGVVFRREYVLDRVLSTKCWGSLLDSPRDRWALLRGRVPLSSALETEL